MSNDRLARKVLSVILDKEVLDMDLEEVPEEFKDVAEYLRRPLQDEDQRNKLMAEEELEQLFGM
ncbi:MAG: hypothetical protein ACKV1O_03120, partial [Saprospiraceae bacterium]